MARGCSREAERRGSCGAGGRAERGGRQRGSRGERRTSIRRRRWRGELDSAGEMAGRARFGEGDGGEVDSAVGESRCGSPKSRTLARAGE